MDQFTDRRSQIDIEIRDLEARLLILRAARNALAPINQLPPDVFLQIFGLLGRTKGKANAILQITWVSRQWRDIAIDCASLWTVLDNSNVKEGCIETWLERSRSSLLSIRLLSLLSVHTTHLRKVFAHSDRITTLRLSRRSTSMDDLCSILTTSGLPALKEFYLKFSAIPNGHFEATAPTLQVLLLESCQFDIASALASSQLPSLTQLSIISPRWTIQADLLLERLSGLPSLKVLILNAALAEPVAGSMTPSRIHIPNLELDVLTIRGSSKEAQVWFIEQQNVIRQGTIVSCSFLSSWPEEEERDVTTILTALRRIPMIRDEDIVMKSIDITETSHLEFQIRIVYHDRQNSAGQSSTSGGDPGGLVEFRRDVYTSNSLLVMFSYLKSAQMLENINIIRFQRGPDSFGGDPEHEFPLSMAELIAGIPHLKHVQLRARFAFVEAFLLALAKTRQSPHDGVDILETVSIETTQPPTPHFDDDVGRHRKPIKILVLKEDQTIEGYDGFAERVVISGSESHLQLYRELDSSPDPIRAPSHPLEGFNDLDSED